MKNGRSNLKMLKKEKFVGVSAITAVNIFTSPPAQTPNNHKIYANIKAAIVCNNATKKELLLRRRVSSKCRNRPKKIAGYVSLSGIIRSLKSV